MEENYNDLFNYKIIYSNKRKRTIAFKVKDNVLIVTSPKKVLKGFLMQLIEKRKWWTIERMQKKKKRREFISDNKILFLGKEVNIKYNENKLLKNGGYCELDEDKLVVNISNNWTDELLEQVIKDWYKVMCAKLLEERVVYYSQKYNLQYGKITIKEQKTVWGTCNFKNNLTFNWKIMMFEESVVDYLVVHELTHTVHKNHSSEYWKAVEDILPNYRESNRKLKSI